MKINSYLFLVFLTFAPLEFFAQNTLSIQAVETGTNADFDLNVSLQNQDNIAALQFDINYNATAFTLLSGHELTATAPNHTFAISTPSAGIVRVIIYSASNAVINSGSGLLVRLKMKSNTLPGTFGFTFTNAVASSATSAALTISGINQNVVVKGPILTLLTNDMSFGRVPMGSVATRQISIKNTGNLPLVLSGNNSIAPFAVVDSYPISINPNVTKNLTIGINTVTKINTTLNLGFQNNDPDPIRNLQSVSLSANVYAVNEIHIGNGSGVINSEVEIPVSVNNMESFNGFQFDVLLPANISFVENSIMPSSRFNGHIISASIVNGNVLRVIAYSGSNMDFNGNSGELFRFKLKPAVSSGTYNLSVSNPILSNTALGNILSDSFNGSIQINSPNLTLSTSSISYGNVPITESRTTNVTLYNTGNSLLIIDSIVKSSTQNDINTTLPIEILPGGNKMVTLNFNPTTKGSFFETVSFRYNGADFQKIIGVQATVFSPNYVMVQNQLGYKNQLNNFFIVLKNNEAVRAVQFDVELPAGFTLIPSNITTTARSTGFTVSASLLSGNIYRILLYSVSSLSMGIGDGAILNFPVTLSSTLNTGIYSFIYSNVVISNTSNQNVSSTILEDGKITVVDKLPSTWNGATSTDWNTASNWTPSGVPADGAAIAIPNVTNKPILDANHSIGDINLSDGATLALNGKTLTIVGTLKGIGTIKGDNTSSLVLNGTGTMGTLYLDQTTLGTTNTLQNLTINRTSTGTVSLGNALSLIGVFTPTAGTLTTGGFLTLKSNASGTATIASGTGNYISGNVTVERYLPAKRAYRFLSSPVTTATSIYANWQESGVSAAGLGTQITGTGGAINGFDDTTTNNSSLFTYNNTTGAWAAVTNTNINTLASGTPYRLMVRGDRTLSLANNTPTPTATTLRATGTLITGSKTVSGSELNQNLEGYSFIGNPYQAPVDIKAVLTSATGMNTSFYYVWDPTRATRGAYVTGILGSGTNSIEGSSVNNYLQPGQACFVKTSSATTASLTFEESHKYTTTANQGVFRFANTSPASIRLTLYDTNALAVNDPALDGLVVFFDTNGNNDVDGNDAGKFMNLDETMATNNNGSFLSVESRAIALPTDIIPLEISQYRGSNYTIVAKGSNLSSNHAYLYDNYLATSTEIPQTGTVNYSYTVDATNILTTATDRFSIKFASKTLGVEDTKGTDFVIYPNPSKGGSFSVVMPNSITDAKLIIYSTIGQEVYTTNLSSTNSNQIKPDKPLAGGVYYVKITSEGKTTCKKLIIE